MLEGIGEQIVQFLVRKPRDIDTGTRTVGGLSEGCPRVDEILDQAQRAAQVGLHRRAHHFLDAFHIGVDKGVEHERDLAAAGESTSLPGFAVDLDFSRELLEGLPEQMGQHIGASFTGHPECVRIAGGSKPKRQLRLDRPR